MVDTSMPALLATKLYVPRLRVRRVLRPRLAARLREAVAYRLVLVSAPAGFGKSTLLSEWAHDCRQEGTGGMPVAWLSLDEGDNDPVRFWSYLVAALQTVQPGSGAEMAALLRAPNPPAIEAILGSLLNELATLSADCALVLDDYHAIQAGAIHRGMEFLLAHLPAPLHLVIAGHADPPLPLALLRSRGEMLELRAADLRFTPEEAAQFLNQVAGLDLTRAEVALLDARTEGWVAALQLAALSMQGEHDLHSSINGFHGSHRYVFDYLAQEILGRQPKAVQSFLLHTAVLDRLCGPLCNAVTGEGNGQAMLDQLEHTNLFLWRRRRRRCAGASTWGDNGTTQRA